MIACAVVVAILVSIPIMAAFVWIMAFILIVGNEMLEMESER